MALFEDEFILNCHIDEVFEFLIRPANILKVSDPATGMRFVNPPEVVSLGARLNFELMALGQVQKGEHEITVFTPPQLIVEEQRKGVMKAWRHEHIFEAQGRSTRIIDRIQFEPPGGLIGFIATESRILDALEGSYFHRQRELKRLLEKAH